MKHTIAELPDSLRELALLKFSLLAQGMRIEQAALIAVENAKGIIRTRSGASGGLDIVLPNDIHVNVPIDEGFSAESEYSLVSKEELLFIVRNGEIVSPVELQPVPQYYTATTTYGTPMVRIGQMCSGDRFCYGMTGPYCVLWETGDECRFCSIALNRKGDSARKTRDELMQALDAAISDSLIPARHVLIGGGTANLVDMGAVDAAEICALIKSKHDISCYVMICAPSDDRYIEELHTAGADELGMNIEFWSAEAWKRYIPGKHKWIGKGRYLSALKTAVSVFGPVNTRSLLVVGLESKENTLDGVAALASMGVMPILSPFRPLSGTAMENERGFTGEEYLRLYEEALEICSEYGIPVGPTCVACQNNTLAVPLSNGIYHRY